MDKTQDYMYFMKENSYLFDELKDCPDIAEDRLRKIAADILGDYYEDEPDFSLIFVE